MERRLASVRRIAATDPIAGADKIICVTVDGWKLVSAKENGFNVGDLVIYFEIDSFLPVREEFEWLRKSSFKTIPGLGEGFRIKTIKLRGQVSQGLIVPMSDFLNKDIEGNGQWYFISEVEGQHPATYVSEGDDLTEFLGVKKYEKPIPANMQGRTKGSFPSFIRKTDEERIQNNFAGVRKWIFKGQTEPVTCREAWVDNPYADLEIEKLDHIAAGDSFVDDGPTRFFKKDGEWYFIVETLNPPEIVADRAVFEKTLKLDGSSMTLYHFDGQIGVCSRNLELKRDPTNPFWSCAIDSGLLAFLIQDGRNIAIQGELMGPGVQGNREELPRLSFWLFNVFDIDEQRYWTPAERIPWFDKMMVSGWIPRTLDASIVFHASPLGYFTWTPETTVQDLLDMADIQNSVKHNIAEGIVFKSMVPNGPSFKAISNKFLLKEAD